jgi:hypothetical protein
MAIEALLAGGAFFNLKSEDKAPKGSKPIPGLSFCWALCCNWMKPNPVR